MERSDSACRRQPEGQRRRALATAYAGNRFPGGPTLKGWNPAGAGVGWNSFRVRPDGGGNPRVAADAANRGLDDSTPWAWESTFESRASIRPVLATPLTRSVHG